VNPVIKAGADRFQSVSIGAGIIHPLLPKLKQLKLSGMLNTLEIRAAQAVEGHLSPTEFLALLLDDELERRNQGQLRLRLTQAGCQEGKTLAHFDFGAVPTLSRSQVLELATGNFVGRRENILVCGPTGVGKSHIASALSYEAIKRGYRVIMRPVYQMLNDLQAARADGSYRRKLWKLIHVDLLVLDDFGLRPLSAQAIDDLYEIISERYERRSIIITSNRAMEEWPEVFGDGLLASAALDRLTHHAQTLVIRGRSYRQLARRKEEPKEIETKNTKSPETDFEA
jgi:DNA replication protein DnaC